MAPLYLFILFSLVTAQNFAGEPSCAHVNAARGFPSIQDVVATCLISAYDQSDLASAASAGLAVCASTSTTEEGAQATTAAAASTTTSVALSTSSKSPSQQNSPATSTTVAPSTTQTSHSTTPASTSITTSSVSGSSTTQPATVITPTPAHHSRSQAWIAGVVVGAVILIALVAIGGFLIGRRRRVSDSRSNEAGISALGIKAELHAEPVRKMGGKNAGYAQVSMAELENVHVMPGASELEAKSMG